MITEKDIPIINYILSRGSDVEIKLRPKTGEVVILEVKKTIKNGKQ